jgi:molecular chaperone GrpE
MPKPDITDLAQPDTGSPHEQPTAERDRYLRLLADFDNYRRRVEREHESAAQSGREQMIRSLLNVVDDFERALPYVDAEPSPLAEGVNSIYRKLLGVLENEGVTAFNSVGEVFNPALHEAVGSTATSDYPAGVVTQELRRGYRQGEKVLRPAHVLVSR